MKTTTRQSGISLSETTLVVAIAAVLIGLAIPSVRLFVDSFESRAGALPMISAALSSARAIAAKNQRYAGIRFQRIYKPGQPSESDQYMIFIVHDPEKTNMRDGFRAVEGIEPIALPKTVGVIDMTVRTNHGVTSPAAIDAGWQPLIVDFLDDTDPANLDAEGGNIYVTDATSLSILFSPSGRLVIHNVRVRNKDALWRPVDPTESSDDVFNSPENISDFGIGMFIQDDYAELGLGAESSRNGLIIYDKSRFDPATAIERFDYLTGLNDQSRIYINPYTGRIMNRSR